MSNPTTACLDRQAAPSLRIAPPGPVAGGFLWAPPGPLGNTAKSLTPPPTLYAPQIDRPVLELVGSPASPLLAYKPQIAYPADAVQRRIERYGLQSTARDIMLDVAMPKTGHSHRVVHCLRTPKKDAPYIPVQQSKATRRCSYRNVQRCASVWACPICASAIAERRRQALVAAVAAHKAKGGRVLLATRTFPHTEHDTITQLLTALKPAENVYKQGSPWKRLAAKFGIVGTVRSVECTYGRNGWHPHIHELLFLAPDAAPHSLDDLADALYARWSSACARAGLRTPSRQHGVDVRDGAHAARYASKWGLEDELTKWHVKRGKAESLTPFDLLRVVRHCPTETIVRLARSLYREYALAFHGKRQLVASPSLRALFAESDEDIVQSIEPDADLLGLLSLGAWQQLVRKELRGPLLEAAEVGGWPAVLRFLDTHRDAATPLASLTVPVPTPHPGASNA